MSTQFALRKIDRLTQRLHILSLHFAEKAAELGNSGNHFAVIAGESKRLACEIEIILDQIFTKKDQSSNDDFYRSIVELAEKGTMLAQNSYLETCRIQDEVSVVLLVDVEELRKIFFAIIQAIQPDTENIQSPHYPLVAETNHISHTSLNLALISVGEFLIAENLEFITEIHFYRQRHSISENHSLLVRGLEFPIIDLKLLLKGQTNPNPQRVIFFDNLPSNNPDKPIRFALIADSSIFWRTQYGKSTPKSSNDIFRESWLLSDGRTVNFLNWSALLEQHDALFRQPEFEDLLKLGDIEIQSLLKKCEMPDLVNALKACSPRLLSKIKSQMSAKAIKELEADLAKSGSVPIADVEIAQDKIIKLAFGE